MSIHQSPIALPPARRGHGCLLSLSCLVLGVVLCAAAVAVLNRRHVDRVRQWHAPHGDPGTITVWHAHTWGSALGIGYDRYEVVAGTDPSGSYGRDVPASPDLGTGNRVDTMTVAWKSHTVVITYPDGDRATVPRDRLKGR